MTAAALQRHAGQLKAATPNTPDAQGIVHKLDIHMREAAALKNELVDIVNERDDARKIAGLANNG